MKSINGLEIFDGNLLVIQDPPNEMEGGILMPEQSQKAKTSGTVVLASKKMKGGSPARFAKGDRVLFQQHMVGNFCKVEAQ